MSRFHPQRDTLDQSKFLKLAAIFWGCLFGLYLLSLWN